MSRRLFAPLVAVALLGGTVATLSVADSSAVHAQVQRKARLGKLCPNPNADCHTAAIFEPYDMPFEVPEDGGIFESEPFFAVVLRSFKVADGDDKKFIPESERLKVQDMFPDRKVFASRASPEPGSVFYVDVPYNVRFLAIYGGKTQAEANGIAAEVKSGGKYTGAYVKKMQVSFNGT